MEPKTYTCVIYNGDEPVGSGFLVRREDRLIATCYYVLAPSGQAVAGLRFGVRFLHPEAPDQRMAAIALAAASPASDVALLQLEEEPPAMVAVAPLVPSQSTGGKEFVVTTYGHLADSPAAEFLSAHGRVVGESRWKDDVRLQLDIKNILPSMSGAPVTVPEAGGVVGLVSKRFNIDPQTQVWMRDSAWAVMVEALRQLDPTLPIAPPAAPGGGALPVMNIDQQRVISITGGGSAPVTVQQTEGGAYVAGAAHAGRDFIGRDNITFNETRFEIGQIFGDDAWVRPADRDPHARWENLIGRQGVLQAIHQQLRESGESQAKAALFGLPGFGKSAVAAAYAHHYGDAATYPGGVLWATVGNASADDIARIVNRWAAQAYHKERLRAAFAGREVQFDADAARHILGGHGPLLVVIEDVRNTAVVAALRTALPNEAFILLTTTDRQLAATFVEPGSPLEIGPLENEELVVWLRTTVPDVDPQQLAALVQLGARPQTYRLLVQQLRERSTQERRRTAIEEFVTQVQRGQGSTFDTAAQVAMQLAYDEVADSSAGERAELRRRLRLLGVLVGVDADFSTELAAHLWQVSTDEAAESLESTFARRSLVSLTAEGRWSQPAVVRSFLQGQLSEEEANAATIRYVDFVLERYTNADRLTVRFSELDPDLVHIFHVGHLLGGRVSTLTGQTVDASSLQEFLAQAPPEQTPAALLPWLQRAQQFALSMTPHLLASVEAQAALPHWLSMGVVAAHLTGAESATGALLVVWYKWRMIFDDPHGAIAVLQVLKGMAETSADRTLGKLWVLSELGLVYHRLGQTEAALAAFDEAVALATQSPADELPVDFLVNLYLNYADFHLARNQPTRARDYLERTEPLLPHIENEWLGIRLLQSMSTIYTALEDYDAALRGIEALEPVLELPGNFPAKAELLLSKGYFHFHQGELESAFTIFQEALSCAEEGLRASAQLIALNYLAHVMLAQDKPGEAHEYIQRAVALIDRVHDKTSEARTLATLGMTTYALGDQATALEHLTRALTMLHEAKVTTLATETIALIGKIYQNSGQLQTGLTYFKELLATVQTVENRNGEIVVLSTLALFSYQQDDQLEANQYLERAQSLLDLVTDASDRARVQSLLSGSYLTLGKTNEGVALLQEALHTWRQLGNIVKQAELRVALALVALEQRNLAEAQLYFDELAPLFESVESKPIQAQFCSLRGYIHMEKEEFDLALHDFARAEALGKETGNHELVVTVGNNTALVYARTNKLDLALRKYEELYDLAQTLERPAIQAALLGNLGMVHLFRQEQEAGVTRIKAAIELMESHGLTADSAGQTIGLWHLVLSLLRYGDRRTGLYGALSLQQALGVLIHATSAPMAEMLFFMLSDFKAAELDRWFQEQIAAAGDDTTLREMLRLYRSLVAQAKQRTAAQPFAIPTEQLEKDFMHHWWGRLHLAANSYAAALTEFNRAIELKMDQGAYYADRGWAHRGVGDYRAAVRDFDQALRLNGQYAAAYLGRGVAYFEQGDPAALPDLVQAAKLEPQNALAFQWRGAYYLALDDTINALPDLEQAVKLEPEGADHIYWRALVQLRKGDYAAAIQDLNRAYELDTPNSPPRICTMIWRGLARELAGQPQYAQADWKNAEQQARLLLDSAYQHFLLALHAVLTDRRERAYAEYQKALKLRVIPHLLLTHIGHLRLLQQLLPKREWIGQLHTWLDQNRGMPAAAAPEQTTARH